MSGDDEVHELWRQSELIKVRCEDICRSGEGDLERSTTCFQLQSWLLHHACLSSCWWPWSSQTAMPASSYGSTVENMKDRTNITADQAKVKVQETVQGAKETSESWTGWAKDRLSEGLGMKGDMKVDSQEMMDKAGNIAMKTNDTVSDFTSGFELVTSPTDLHSISREVPTHLRCFGVEHMQSTGWKVNQRAKSIIIDPGLYLFKKFDIVTTKSQRALPTSFKLFTGSAWVMLTRSFLEYCIWGWENLPRTVLMYYVNFVSSPEGYFHTVICNNDEFRNTAISHDLHYIAWGNPPKQHPLTLTLIDFSDMVKSNAPFARKFSKNNPVLDKIDRELLGRSEGRFTPGGWCIGKSDDGEDPCSLRGDDSVFLPGPGAERLQALVNRLMLQDHRNGSCSNLGFDQVKREWIAP